MLTKNEDAAYTLLFFIPSALWTAWGIKTLWGWFMVPFGVPAISVAWSYGLLCLTNLMCRTFRTQQDEGTTKNFQRLANSAAIVALALGLGWIAHSFM